MKTTSLISLCLAVTTCGLIATEIDAFAPAKFSSPSRSIVSRTRPLLMADPVGIGESLSNAWASYNDALEANPLLVKSVTASFILGAADLAGQTIEQKQRGDEDTNIDIARVARFATFGLVLQAPWNHFYYQLLDGALPPTPDPWTETTAVKTFIDQFVQAPIFTVLIFGFLGFLDGKNAQDIKQQLDDDYKDTMFANCKSEK
jgi:peroxisomal membrane protein 2